MVLCHFTTIFFRSARINSVWDNNLIHTWHIVISISLCDTYGSHMSLNSIVLKLTELTERKSERDMGGGGLRRLTEGKLHVRDCGNHKLIGLGINPQSKFKPLCWSRISPFSLWRCFPFPLGRTRFRQPTKCPPLLLNSFFLKKKTQTKTKKQ